MTKHIIGIDVSKDRLDVHRLCDGVDIAFANDDAGLTALLRWLGHQPARAVFEATGRYHRALEDRFHRSGHHPIKVNPASAKSFFNAPGVHAKTDKTDARMLAVMGAALNLNTTPPRSKSLTELAELAVARRALVKDKTAARNRTPGLTLSLLKRQNAVRLRRIEADLAAVDAAIEACIAGDPELAGRRDVLISIPGVSDVTAAILLALAPELGGLDDKQAGKLAGLAPIDRQSGKWKGRATIRGGRADLRQSLYMPALAAMNHNPDMRAFAERLKAKGKPFKIVCTAVMRKLFVLANALIRDNRKWEPKHA